MSQQLKEQRQMETMRLLYENKGYDLSDEQIKYLVYCHKRPAFLFRAFLQLLLALALIAALIWRFW